MAFTATALTSSPQGWAISVDTDDASGCEAILAATTGKSHYIENITISAGADITVTIGAGETGTAVTAKLIGPVPLNDSVFSHRFVRPVKVATATAIVMDASGAGTIGCVIEGFTR